MYYTSSSIIAAPEPVISNLYSVSTGALGMVEVEIYRLIFSVQYNWSFHKNIPEFLNIPSQLVTLQLEKVGPHQYLDLWGRCLVLHDVENVDNSTSLWIGPKENRKLMSCKNTGKIVEFLILAPAARSQNDSPVGEITNLMKLIIV